MISADKKSKVINKLQTHKTDTGSTAVQVGIMSERITELTEHLKVHKKDHSARRGLLQLVGQRKRLLRYLSETDQKSYLQLIEKLGLKR